MRRNLGRFWMFFVGLALGLIISFTIGTEGLFHISKAEASPSDQEYVDQGKVGRIYRKFKEMNKKIDAAIEDYKNDVIEEDELKLRLNQILLLREQIYDIFPKVLGADFRDWIMEWDLFNSFIRIANRQIDESFTSEATLIGTLEVFKKAKEGLEKTLLGWE